MESNTQGCLDACGQSNTLEMYGQRERRNQQRDIDLVRDMQQQADINMRAGDRKTAKA